MSNKFTKARKQALAYLGMDEASNVPYSDIAKRIAFKDAAIIEGLDLNDRLSSRAMILAWADRQERIRQRSYG